MKRFWLFSCLLGIVAMPLLGQDFKITIMPGFVVALSSSGKVTGGPGPSYVWSRTGGVQYLGDSTHPQAINKMGEVVGQFTLPDDVTSHAFLWTSSGGIQDLGSPQGGNSQATAINDAEEATGWSASPDGTVIHAFFWSAATGTVDLGTPPDGHTQSYGIAINDLGEVLGADGIPSYATPRACFRWTQSSGMQQSTLFGGCYRINHKGQVVGYHPDAYERPRAAIWEPDGSILDLGTLSGDLASNAVSINRAGHVTGYSRPTAGGGLQRSFFWTPTGGMIDIGRLPEHQNGRSIPAGINNRDQIVGENGAAYLWSKTIGIAQVVGANYPAYGSLNDAGQFLGTTPNPVLATPIMHATLTSSQNPSNLGQNVTFTAKVKAIVGLPPDGEQVTFLDGKTVLGTGVLSKGIAILTTSALKAGTNYITTSYPGDDNYYPNKSAVLSQVVNP